MKIKQDAEKSISQQKGNLKHILRQMTMKKTTIKKSMRYSKGHSQREVHSDTGLPQKHQKNLK